MCVPRPIREKDQVAHEHTRDMKKDFHLENKSVEIKSSKSDNRFSLLYKGAFIKDKKLKQATELRKKSEMEECSFKPQLKSHR